MVKDHGYTGLQSELEDLGLRLPQLDAVRALAIGLVIVEHYGGEAINSYLPLGMGSLGVGLFFCLSGYLITSILLKEYDSGLPRVTIWTNFFARRFLRLIPPYWAWIAVLVVLGISPVAESWPWHAAYLSNVWISLGNPPLAFWSLAVEEQFYLIWPFIIALAPRRHLLPVIVASTFGASLVFKIWMAQVGVSGSTIQTLLFSNLTELGSGSLLGYVAYRNGRPYDFSWYTRKVHTWFSLAAALSLAAAIVAWYKYGTAGSYRYYVNDAMCAVSMVWLLIQASIGIKGLIGRIFDNKIVQYIGQISYGIYLTHNFIPDILRSLFGEMSRPVLGASSLLATLVITTLSWHYFEKPILRLKKYFRSKSGTRDEPPATVARTTI